MNNDLAKSPAPMGHVAIHDRVIDLLGSGNKGTVLDVPAGEGALAERIISLGYEVLCADLYPEIFKLEGTEVITADLDQRLPFETNQFDVVVCVEGLEHIESPANAIREFARVAKPGGRLIVSVPNIMNVEERLKWLLGGYTSHFKPLSQSALRKISEDYDGMEEIALHVNPLGYSEIRYLLEKNNFTLLEVLRDKSKSRSWLYLPIVWLIRIIGRFGSKQRQADYWTEDLNSDPVLYGGNTLIFAAELKESLK